MTSCPMVPQSREEKDNREEVGLRHEKYAETHAKAEA
jgi:hypothetical protein